MNIGEQINNLRKQHGLSQDDFANLFNVSRQTISNWENGKSLPDIVSIIRMSDLYDVSLDELLKGDKVLMEKIEKDAMAVKVEKKIIKFAWISIVLGVIVIILGNIFEDNPVIDFINGALPWILLGLMLLFAMLYLNKENRKA